MNIEFLEKSLDNELTSYQFLIKHVENLNAIKEKLCNEVKNSLVKVYENDEFFDAECVILSFNEEHQWLTIDIIIKSLSKIEEREVEKILLDSIEKS